MTLHTPIRPTHVAGLDMILGGGFVSDALVFLVGPAGAGKTILASQAIFEAARRGTPTLILTTFSESPVKLLSHLRAFSFYDDELVGQQVVLHALQSIVGDDVRQAGRSIARTIRDSRAGLVLIDGFQGLGDLFDAPVAVQPLLASLATQLAFLHTTVLVTLEGQGRDPALSSALTTADAILDLEFAPNDWRQVRRVEVVKQRGVAPLPGKHAYSITPGGVTVAPRLETRLPSATRPRPQGRAAFGLPELDNLLHGGLTVGSTTILAGAPGVGKTTLGLHWASAAAQPSETTLFVTFSERVEQLQAKAIAFGLDLDSLLASGALRLLRLSPVEIVPDDVGATLLAALTPDTTRLIVDDLAALLQELGSRSRNYLSALVDHLYQAGVTSLFLVEIEPLAGLQIDLSKTPISLVAENVIIAQQEVAQGALHRILAVLKMRYSDYDRTLRELILHPSGVRVLAPAHTAPGVLEAAATTSGGFAPGDASVTGSRQD